VIFMIMTLFVIAIVFMLICFFIGFGYGNFGFAYLGFFTMLINGIFLFQSGLQLVSGTMESPIGSHIFVTTYNVLTTTNEPIIALLAWTFFLIPLAGIMLTTYLAFRG